VKKTLETLTIRVEVLTGDLHRLTQNVGDLAESVDQRFASVDQRFDALETLVRDGHAELRRAIDDGQAALMSAVLSLGRR
jgi:uncharacterized protein YoxC